MIKQPPRRLPASARPAREACPMFEMVTPICRPGRRSSFACLLLALAASGCSIPLLLEQNASAIGEASQAMRDTTRSLEGTSHTLHALEPSLAQVATLGPELNQLSALRADLAEVALLRKDLTQIAGMNQSLERLSELDQRLAQLTALAPELERLTAMREPIAELSRVAAQTSELQQPLRDAAGLEPSLRGLTRSVNQLSTLTAPLERTSTALERILALIARSPWLLGVGFLIWLAGTCAAAGIGTYIAGRALAARRDPRALD